MKVDFSREEVRKAIMESDGEKNSKLYGMNFKFLLECWEFSEDIIVKFVKEFHENVIIPKVTIISFITFIPKNSNPQGLKDYKLICLVGCLYKILAKILAYMLKVYLKGIISPCQTTFVPGR